MGEALTRIVFYRSMDFDMEMWKYATQIKIASSDPELALEHLPNQQAFLMGVEVSTNSFGLRNDETILKKPTNTYRILVIGDSMTMGWGVRQEKTYPAQLEELLNAEPPDVFRNSVKFEVLNLGVGNYNTVQEIVYLRKVGLQFEPDIIILGYFINDAEPTPLVREGFLIENSYLYAFILSRFRGLPIGNDALTDYQDYYSHLYLPDQQGWKATKNSLIQFAEIGLESGIPIAIVIIPELHDLSDTYPFSNIHDELASIANDEKIPIVDLLPIFSGYTPEEDLWVSPNDAHLNEIGQSLAAHGIYDALANGSIKQ